MATPETKTSKAAIINLAQHIEDSIENEGKLPEILALLPQNDLIKESIRYFYHYIWLNSYYFISQENILHIEQGTEAVLAKYRENQHRILLLLVNYPDDRLAESAHNAFITRYLPDLSQKRIVQIEDGTWTGCVLVHHYFIAVFNGPNQKKGLRLLEEVQSKVTSGTTPLQP
jgi:hypothetical protein